MKKEENHKINIQDIYCTNNEDVIENYKENYNRWLFNNSDNIWLDGRLLSVPEKIMLKIDAKFNKIDAKEIRVCDTKNGFPLKEFDFIEIELKQKIEFFENSKGKIINLTIKKQLELYINYLEKRKNELSGDKVSKNYKRDIIKDIETALSCIELFEGLNLEKEKIMTDTDYKKLREYTSYMIEYEKLPDNIKPIKKIGLSNTWIRYTFFKMHEEIFGTTKRKPYFIDFLHEVFEQFKGTEWNSIYAHFSEPPPQYNTKIEKMKKT